MKITDLSTINVHPCSLAFVELGEGVGCAPSVSIPLSGFSGPALGNIEVNAFCYHFVLDSLKADIM